MTIPNGPVYSIHRLGTTKDTTTNGAIRRAVARSQILVQTYVTWTLYKGGILKPSTYASQPAQCLVYSTDDPRENNGEDLTLIETTSHPATGRMAPVGVRWIGPPAVGEVVNRITLTGEVALHCPYQVYRGVDTGTRKNTAFLTTIAREYSNAYWDSFSNTHFDVKMIGILPFKLDQVVHEVIWTSTAQGAFTRILSFIPITDYITDAAALNDGEDGDQGDIWFVNIINEPPPPILRTPKKCREGPYPPPTDGSGYGNTRRITTIEHQLNNTTVLSLVLDIVSDQAWVDLPGVTTNLNNTIVTSAQAYYLAGEPIITGSPEDTLCKWYDSDVGAWTTQDEDSPFQTYITGYGSQRSLFQLHYTNYGHLDLRVGVDGIIEVQVVSWAQRFHVDIVLLVVPVTTSTPIICYVPPP